MQTAPAPDYVFTDKDNLQLFTDPGDYQFEVIEFECAISSGPKTRGSRVTNVKLKLLPSGVHVYEQLIFHPSMGWKIDTFVKSTGIAVPIGQMPPELARGNERLLIGLRGWCTVFIDEYQGKKKNRVSVWITNRGKVDRLPPPAETTGVDEDGVPF